MDFDFISLLDADAALGSFTVEVSVYQGVDPVPEAILSGSATASGLIVTQLITGGVVGVVYLLTCSITTTLGEVKILQGKLAVISTTPYS